MTEKISEAVGDDESMTRCVRVKHMALSRTLMLLVVGAEAACWWKAGCCRNCAVAAEMVAKVAVLSSLKWLKLTLCCHRCCGSGCD